MADGRIKSPLGTSRTRRPTAMGNMGSRVEPGCPPPHALAGSTLAAPATSCSRTPRADARTPRGLAGSWRGSSAKARRFARKGSTRQRRKSGSKCSRCGHGRRAGGGGLPGAGRVRARVAHCQSPVHTSRDRARPRPPSAADAPGDVATSLFTSPARPRWQIDQTDTRTLLHYAVMLRDKMAPQKVRASTGGDVTGNSGAQAALMLCAWLWLWQSEDAAEALKQQAEQLLQQVRPQALARMLARLRARMHAAWPVDTRIGTRPWASRTFMFRAASRVQHGRMSWPRVRN